MAAFADHYRTLGVHRHAEQAVIEAAYRAMAKGYHPDRNPGDRTANTRVQQIIAAYAVLSDPARRRAYDREWDKHHAAPSPPRPAPKPPRPGATQTTTTTPPPRPPQPTATHQPKSDPSPQQKGRPWYGIVAGVVLLILVLTALLRSTTDSVTRPPTVRIPTPTPEGMTVPRWDVAPLLEAVPSGLPVCLRRVEHEVLNLATMRQGFPGVPDALARLKALGWQTALHRQFLCDPIPETGLSWLDMSVHLFQDAASAAAAVPFFAHARTVGTQLTPVSAMTLGDSTAAIAGPSENGTEYTLYLSTGPVLFRVSAIAADGVPQADVESVMTALYRDVLDRAREEPSDEPSLPAPTPAPPTAAIPSPTPTLPPPPTQPPSLSNCDPSYPDVCIPPAWEAGDLDCQDVQDGNFRVLPPDPHRLDGPYDGSNPSEPDGIGCEWN